MAMDGALALSILYITFELVNASRISTISPPHHILFDLCSWILLELEILVLNPSLVESLVIWFLTPLVGFGKASGGCLSPLDCLCLVRDYFLIGYQLVQLF